jgi:hypothetical protein
VAVGGCLAVLLAPGGGAPGQQADGGTPSVLISSGGSVTAGTGGAGGTIARPGDAGHAAAGQAAKARAARAARSGTGTRTQPASQAQTTPAGPGQPAPTAGATFPTAVTSTHAKRASSPPPATQATTPAASAAPGSSAPAVSSNGVVTATNGTVYSCSNYPVSGNGSNQVSIELVNNTPDSLTIYYVETPNFAGYTGEAGPGDTSATLVIGGVYLIENLAGNGGCLGAVQINGPGTVTVS